jgi:hypothetical protein
MKTFSSPPLRACALAAGFLGAAITGRSQLAYGVDSQGNLFNLNLSAPSVTTTIGNLGFVPDGIDFRSGTNTLFAIDVGPSAVQLYTIDLGNAAATAVGSGFALSGTVGGVSYDLTGATAYGFDFNPTTLQADGSIRIRFVANNGVNLRLNSSTGGLAAVDGGIAGNVGAVAYINNAQQTMGGATALYDVDYTTDSLFLQNPPNAGTLVSVGSLGVNVSQNIAFDIFTDPNSSDTGIGGDFAYLVDSNSGGAAIYSLNLGTGAATIFGSANRDFAGGFALAGATAVPEPAHFGLGAAAALGVAAMLRRRRASRARAS